MNRLLPLAILTLLTACDRQSIASAGALPAYQAGAKAVIARNLIHPYTEPQKQAIKAADDKLFSAMLAIVDAEVAKAVELHREISGL